MGPPRLIFRDVKKCLGNQIVFDGLNLDLPLSGITFVVGASGAGKSVFCRLAVGLLRPDAGEIELLGERVDRLSEKRLVELRAQAPYLVQGPALLDWLTLEENVELVDRTSRGKKTVSESLERLGLHAVAHRRPPEVSPALRKRTAIARALALKPTLLLLDEPTTGLDRDGRVLVNDTLSLVRSEGVPLLLVSHDYESLERLADSVLEVRNGQIIEHGSARSFLAHARA